MSVKSYGFVAEKQISKIVDVFDYCAGKSDWRGAPDEKPEIFNCEFQYTSYRKITIGDKNYLFGIVQFQKRIAKNVFKNFFACKFGITKIKLKKLTKPLLLYHLKIKILDDLFKKNEEKTSWKFDGDMVEFGHFQLGGWRTRFDDELMTFWRIWKYVQEDMLSGEDNDYYETLVPRVQTVMNTLCDFENDLIANDLKIVNLIQIF